jgi:glycosyltransferase involved in cell wall biosynthesis
MEDAPLAVFVGEGREASALKNQAGWLGLEGKVRWAGRVDGAAALLPAFDVFVLSSRTEGTPIVLLEAMAAGVPIVAAAVGGVPDVVTDREAVLVPADDPAALAAALQAVRNDPASALERAAAGRRRLEEEFAEGPWLTAYDALYRAVIAQRRLRRS